MDPFDDLAEPRQPALQPSAGWLVATALLAVPAVALIVIRLVVGG